MLRTCLHVSIKKNIVTCPMLNVCQLISMRMKKKPNGRGKLLWMLDFLFDSTLTTRSAYPSLGESSSYETKQTGCPFSYWTKKKRVADETLLTCV